MFNRSAALFAKKFDVVVVGGGPGGYVCAIKAAQLGLSTACVEKRGALGGTCLNVGCIPSKALLHASHMYHDATHSFKKQGIKLNGTLEVDVPALMKQKQKSITGLTRGIAGLFKANKVENIAGAGFFKGPNLIEVTNADGSKEDIEADNIVVAVGSEVAGLPGFPKELIDEKDIVSSTGALEFGAVPQSLTVVGGGVIGLELGSVWSRLGAKVHVVEFLNKIMGPADTQVSTEFQKILKKQGLTFDLNSKVVDVKKVAGGVELTWENNETKEKTTQVSEKVLISTGRIPNTANLGMENLGVTLDRAGRIPVNGHLITETNANVYAIGDCIAGPMLAHKAEEDGVYIAEQIADKVKNGGAPPKAEPISYHAVPSVVYTFPEVAWVGKSEDELKKEGVEYNLAVFPLAANSRARANDEAQGMVKLMTSKDDKILGCHIIAPFAGDVLMLWPMRHHCDGKRSKKLCSSDAGEK
eukprot:g2390.t1